jgi:MutL protein
LKESSKSIATVDIGSTIIKIARVDANGRISAQNFWPRDLNASVSSQVTDLLAVERLDASSDTILACSSANGGLRVGILCLSLRFSGAAIRNQVLLAGANPVFAHSFADAAGDLRRVDILIIGGGIDEKDCGPAEAQLDTLDISRYSYDALVYCGNCHLVAKVETKHPGITVIGNPLGETLSDRVGSVFEAVRRSYLDDLVHEKGMSGLPQQIARTVRPTPEVVGRGFLRAVMNQSTFSIVGACVVLDIGGATTDLHYSLEIVSDDSPNRPASGISVARYVFTDLGIVASRDTLLLQLRNHPQLYEFLSAVTGTSVRELYSDLREGTLEHDAQLLAYACAFIALDRFSKGSGPGLPTGSLDRIAQVVLTGGAAQLVDEAVFGRLLRILLPVETQLPLVQIDRHYEIWVSGITWSEDLKR